MALTVLAILKNQYEDRTIRYNFHVSITISVTTFIMLKTLSVFFCLNV